MKPATLGQAIHVLETTQDHELDLDRLQDLVSTGLFADLLKVDPTKVDRKMFRRVIGWKPYNLFGKPFRLGVDRHTTIVNLLLSCHFARLDPAFTTTPFQVEPGREESGSGDYQFVTLRGPMLHDELVPILRADGLEPADLYAVLAWHKADPTHHDDETLRSPACVTVIGSESRWEEENCKMLGVPRLFGSGERSSLVMHRSIAQTAKYDYRTCFLVRFA